MGVLQPSLSDTVSSFSSGIYVLAAELKRSSRLEIGGLGRHSFPKGFYLYVGSAQRNLAHRLRRHLSEHPNGKKLHWHIDYLLAHARVRYIWGFAGPKDWECRLSQYLTGLDGVQIPLNGFGSSDCHCRAHLFYFPEDRLSFVNDTTFNEVFPKGAETFVVKLEGKKCVSPQGRYPAASSFVGTGF